MAFSSEIRTEQALAAESGLLFLIRRSFITSLARGALLARTASALSQQLSLQVKNAGILERLPPRTLGKTSRSRNWNYESSKPHIHRVVDRRAHRIAAGGGGVCKGRQNIRAEI